MPPSGGDFAAAFDRKYRIAVVACHNGDVYIYKQKRRISAVLYDFTVAKYEKLGYTKHKAYDLALKDLKGQYGTTWTKK